MRISGSNNNKAEQAKKIVKIISINQEKSKEKMKTNEHIKIEETIKTMQTNEKTRRVKERFIQSSPFEQVDRYISNVSKSICKIKIPTNIGTIFGTGFLLKEYIAQELFYCLMTNEHVITKDIINKDTTVYIYYDNEFKMVNIKLDEKERYIKSFKDIGLDITVVEILDKDNIYKDYFLSPAP